MPKALTIAGMVVAILIFLLFTLDLAISFPFNRASTMMDIGFLIGGLLLAYLSWSTLRELE